MSGKRKRKPIKVIEPKRASLSWSVHVTGLHKELTKCSSGNTHNEEGENVGGGNRHFDDTCRSSGMSYGIPASDLRQNGQSSNSENQEISTLIHDQSTQVMDFTSERDVRLPLFNNIKINGDVATNNFAFVPRVDTDFFKLPILTTNSCNSFGTIGYLSASLSTEVDPELLLGLKARKGNFSWTVFVQKRKGEDSDVNKGVIVLTADKGIDSRHREGSDQGHEPTESYSFLCNLNEHWDLLKAVSHLAFKKSIFIRLMYEDQVYKLKFSVTLNQRCMVSVTSDLEGKVNCYSWAIKTMMYYFYNVHEAMTELDSMRHPFDFDQGVTDLYQHIRDVHQSEDEAKPCSPLSGPSNKNDKTDSSSCSNKISSDGSGDTFGTGSMWQNSILETCPKCLTYEDTISDVFSLEDDSESNDMGTTDMWGKVTHTTKHIGLIPELRKYQNEAVAWMISRERCIEYGKGSSSSGMSMHNSNILWVPLETLEGDMFWYNKYTGGLAESAMKESPLPAGGILADEMGLGKSIEVLACILNNPCNSRYTCARIMTMNTVDDALEENCCVCGSTRFKGVVEKCFQCCICSSFIHKDCAGYGKEVLENPECPSCAIKQPILSHGTLIISPETIADQWEEEIRKHVKDGHLSYKIYKGVAKHGFVHPKLLAEYDVIITTYAALRADFFHVASSEAAARSAKALRYRKRYAAVPSPLTAITFWRVCVDEAQMVESPTSKVAEMAARIQAQHRWCVTGTPINKGLEDLYGLLVFLGIYPYCIKTWWNKLLFQPYVAGDREPMFRLFQKILWRTTKNDVLDQINIPKQTEFTQWLSFSPVEQHFYQLQREECTARAIRELQQWDETDMKLCTLDKRTLQQLLVPLLKLRQACCHPGLVRGPSYLAARGTLTMDRLLHTLTDKAQQECEEAHRQLLCSLNGLAGISILADKWADAVNFYREAMQSWEENAKIKTDSLQKLHTVHNLYLVLTQRHNGCLQTLEDDTLPEKANNIRDSYLMKSKERVALAEKAHSTLHDTVKKIVTKINWQSPWWLQVISYFQRGGSSAEDALINRIKEDLQDVASAKPDIGSIRGRFSDLNGLKYILMARSNDLQNARQKLLQDLDQIKGIPSKDYVQAAAECCLRPVEGANAPRCKFCEVDDTFADYETALFAHQGMTGSKHGPSIRGKLSDVEEMKRFGGLRGETELDRVFKILLSVSKQKRLDKEIIEEGKDFLEWVDLLKKEFKALREIWFALHQQVSSLDEIEMCTSRLRFPSPGEKGSVERNVVDISEVTMTRLTLLSDKAAAERDLRTKKGRLTYLLNLAKAENSTDGFNPEKCPICTGPLGIQWSVLSCCHCFCCNCIYLLQRQHGISGKGKASRKTDIKCPLCRVSSLCHEISFVSCGKRQIQADDIQIKGNHSTKVESVIKKVIHIGQTDLQGKILIFSTWLDVLLEVRKALAENDISSLLAHGSGKNFQVPLMRFKHDDKERVLLLPLKSGCKGLNITEATHVILVEPILNKANEFQAIGRVHRIGQTKSTYVHRFIVRGTVEERMHRHMERRASRPSARNSEDCSLTIGDLTSLFQYDSD